MLTLPLQIMGNPCRSCCQTDGTVTWGQRQAVQPFGNILQVVEITGDQIYKALDQQYDEKELYFLQMAGIKYTYTKPADATEENPYKVVKAYKADGTEIDRNKTYKAIINDFFVWGWRWLSVFRDTKLIGAINQSGYRSLYPVHPRFG